MSEEFAQEQETIRANVIKLCRDHPAAKKDYRTLLQFYWAYVDGLKTYIPMEILAMLTQPESISRAFRKAVEDKDIVLDKTDEEEREEREQRYREYYKKRREWKHEQ